VRQLTRFRLTQRVARSVGGSRASCRFRASRRIQTERQAPLHALCVTTTAYRVGQKQGHLLVTIILSNLNRVKKITGRFLRKFAVKWILTPPPHLAYVATLPRETLTPLKQAINYKLQCSVATYLRCGGVVNNQIKKGIVLSV